MRRKLRFVIWKLGFWSLFRLGHDHNDYCGRIEARPGQLSKNRGRRCIRWNNLVPIQMHRLIPRIRDRDRTGHFPLAKDDNGILTELNSTQLNSTHRTSRSAQTIIGTVLRLEQYQHCEKCRPVARRGWHVPYRSDILIIKNSPILLGTAFILWDLAKDEIKRPPVH